MNGLLPIGSVVLLKNSTKKIMVIGLCQRGKNRPEKVYDYAAVLYPEGYVAADKLFLFDREQIEKVFALGYQDEEQFAFKEKADKLMDGLRNKEQASES